MRQEIEKLRDQWRAAAEIAGNRDVETCWRHCAAALDAILAADTGGWRSMDSAPRDGRLIEVRGVAGPYGVKSWVADALWANEINAAPYEWGTVERASLRLAGYVPAEWRPITPPQEPPR